MNSLWKLNFSGVIETNKPCGDKAEALRKTFEMMLGFDWRDETKLTFNSRQPVAAEKFFVDYVQSILGNKLKSAEFIREFIN